jgi:hypothetical protein
MKGTCLIESLAPSLTLVNLADPGKISDRTTVNSGPTHDGGFDFDLPHPMLNQSTFFFKSSAGPESSAVPPEFRLLARPVSVESDSSESEDINTDRLQPGESIIAFDEKFDLESLQPQPGHPLPSASEAAVQQEADLPFTLDGGPAPPGEPAHSLVSATRPSAIRQSILHLRRMNSDAQRDSTKPGLFAARRYLMMDGGCDISSPTSRCDSWASLASISSRGHSRNMLLSQGDLSTAWLNPADRPLAVIPAGRALNAGAGRGTGHVRGPQGGVPLPGGLGNNSVWEDGARWDLGRTHHAGPRSNLTPFRMKVDPPSGEQTPISLYDENGFLKRNSGEMELKF